MVIPSILFLYIVSIFFNRWLNLKTKQMDQYEGLWWFIWFIPIIGTMIGLVGFFIAYSEHTKNKRGPNWWRWFTTGRFR